MPRGPIGVDHTIVFDNDISRNCFTNAAVLEPFQIYVRFTIIEFGGSAPHPQPETVSDGRKFMVALQHDLVIQP